MAEPDWAGQKKVSTELRFTALALRVCWYFAAVFLVLGVGSEILKVNLGLPSSSWFLLLIATFLAGIIFKLGWVVAWYLTISK